MTAGLPRRLLRCDRGATALETALVLFFVLLLFIIGILEFGRALWNWNSLLLAVAQGGRFAMVNTGNQNLAACTAPTPTPTITGCSSANPSTLPLCTAVQTNQSLMGFESSSVSITITCTGTSPTTMEVGATYHFQFIAEGLFPSGPIRLSTQVKVPLM